MPLHLVRNSMAVLLIVSGLASSVLASPTNSGWERISALSGGWTHPFLGVAVSGTVYNPSGCLAPDSYVVDAALPGAQLLQAMLITAYASGDEVMFTIDGCAVDRPSVIGIQIRKATTSP